MSKCTFTDLDVRSRLTQKRRLSAFLQKLVRTYLKKDCYIQYTFVSDEYLLYMNQSYLQHDTYTDIITFDLSDPNADAIISDIFISIDRVKENASALKVPYQHELLRVILHGALHLCGFGDKTKKQKEEMRLMEDKWMKKYSTFH
jgi:probable rRNA maturation factor